MFAADVTDPAALDDALEKVHRRGPLTRLAFFQRYRGDGDSWAGEMDLGPTATKTVIEACADRFIPGEDNSILIIASNAAKCVAVEQPPGYHVAKAGMVQLARYYAAKLGPRGIRVNAVSPSTTVKDEAREFYDGFTELNDLYSRISPLGRMGTAAELAETCHFFLSPASSFITGQNLTFDGGLSLNCQEGLARSLAGIEHPGTKKQDKN